MPRERGTKTVAQNRKAYHDYFVEEKFECGLVLYGTEVKSIRNGEAWAEGIHISPYEQGNIFNRDPLRPKKLLLHRNEIRKLDSQVMRQGYPLIPLEIYFKDGKAKLQLGLCKGKQVHDKRDAMAKRDSDREIQRAMRNRQKDG